MIEASLIRKILDGYALHVFGIHGLPHWARVMQTGLRLAEETQADARVVVLFAAFHDARRENDGWDPEHGRRGALLAANLRQELELSNVQFELLSFACSHHAKGLTDGDVTVRTCWDADRLDLWRVGITPRRSRLCTKAALNQELQKWARQRSRRNHIPSFVANEWLTVRART